MSGDMVSADTRDLSTFVEHGNGYVASLTDMFDELEAVRSAARASLDGTPTALAAYPLSTLIALATNNNGYVREVRDSLLIYGGVDGPVTAPESIVNIALTEAGLSNLADLTLAQHKALAERVETEGRVRSLNNLILLAQAQGDLDLVAELEAELEAFHYNQLDPELAHTFVVARNFEAMFGDGLTHPDNFREVANGDRRTEIYERLANEGVTGSRADAEFERIVAAAQFFVDDKAAMDRLDAGNDSVGRADGKVSVDDGIVNFMTATAGTEHLSETYFRGEVIAGYVGAERSFSSDQIWNPGELSEVYTGSTVLGPLSANDKQIAVDAYVDTQSEWVLHPDAPRMVVQAIEPDNDELEAALRQAYAHQAVRLEILGPGDGRAQAAASLFARHALDGLGSEDQAALVSGLTEEYNLEDGLVTEAGLFAAALITPLHIELPDSYVGLDGLGRRRDQPFLALSTLMGLNDGLSPGGDFTPAQSDFVFTLFDQLPPWYGEGFWEAAGERYLGHELGMALGSASYPGDDEAQAFHGDRLAEILMTDEGEEILAVNDTVDPFTRTQLLDTVLYGRTPTDPGHAFNYNDRPMQPVFWNAGDFRLNESASVIADFAVDTGRAQIIATTGDDISHSQEQRIRTLVSTEHGLDLAGFDNNRVDYVFRNQFISVLLDDPGWEPDDLNGDGSGISNPLVNAEMAVVWAQASQPDAALTPAEIRQIREIGGSSEWIDRAGIGSSLNNNSQVLYLAGALERGWTSETFGLTEDLTLNKTINLWTSRPHLQQFATNAERADELEAMANGGTEEYVLAVLGDSLPGGDELAGMHPAVRGRLNSTVAEIDTHRADGATINTIPVFLNTGDLQAQTYLFETTNDDGDKVYVDMAGEFFTSVNDWYNHSRLPPGQVTFTGTSDGKTSGAEFVSPLTGEDYNRITFTTENVVDTTWERAEPWVVGGVTIIGGVAFFINPLAGGAILAGVGSYQVGKGAHGVYQLNQHGGEADWSDPRFRGDVLNVVEGSLTLATAGGTALATNTARRGYNVGRWATGSLRALNIAEGTYSAGTVGYQAYQILESDLPADQKWSLLGQMGFAMTAQGLVPLAVGRGLQRLPFTTAKAYHPGISQEAFDAAQAAHLDDPLHIAMYTYLHNPESFTPPNSPLNTGVGPAVVVAGHNVRGQPHLTGVPPRLVGSGGGPAGSLNLDPQTARTFSLKELARDDSQPVVLNDGTVIQQKITVVRRKQKEAYLTQLEGLYAAAGTPLEPEIQANIVSYIDSHLVDTGIVGRNGKPILEYWIPTNAVDPDTGDVVVYGSIYPGTHADIVAANQALADARTIDPTVTLEDVTLLVHYKNNVRPLASCPDCSAILSDATIISGASKPLPLSIEKAEV